MNTRRLVLASVLAFFVAVTALALLAMRRLEDPRASAPDPALSARSQLSRQEIARHNRPEDCWLLIRGKVYDVTKYIPQHPAPPRTILARCGTESSWAFETKERARPHTAEAWELLETYLIGDALAEE